jgi:hypothetical protein
MGRTKPLPPELKRRPHEATAISLLALAEQLKVLPPHLDARRTVPLIWLGQTPQELRAARRSAAQVIKKRDRWAAITLNATRPTARAQEILVTVQRTRAILRIQPGVAHIWRRQDGAGGLDRRWGWFSIRQPGLWWAEEVALAWGYQVAPPVTLLPYEGEACGG